MGHDTAADKYFHRDLPFDRGVLEAMQPRLVQALELARDGCVVIEDASTAVVRSDETRYTVRTTHDGGDVHVPVVRQAPRRARTRKHVLAASLVRREVRA